MAEPDQPRRHAIVYCHAPRASLSSLKAQERRCRRKAEALGATDITVICESDRARLRLDRRGIQEVLAMLRAGGVAWVVAEMPTRFSRSVADVRRVTQKVAQAGATLVYISP